MRHPMRQVYGASSRTTSMSAAVGLVGAAVPISGGGEHQSKLMPVEQWQSLLWDTFDVLGELSFGASWIANALSRITLHAGLLESPGQAPTRVEDPSDPAAVLMSGFAGGASGQAEMLRQQGFHLAIPGDTYLITEPTENGSFVDGRTITASRDEIKQIGSPPDARYQLQEDQGLWVDLHPDTIVTKIMQSHPRRRWEPWSSNRAALPILAELRLLSQHIVSSAQSRLSGAGLFIHPIEIQLPVDPRYADKINPFMSMLADAMMAARRNPDGPEAMTPISIGVPADYVDKFVHMTFSTPFDERVLELREAAIKRYASAIDLPAEVLLGIADLQHWNAWAVSEQALKFHIEPKMLLLCHAYTKRFLHPVLRAMDVNPDRYVVWWDSSELAVQPDRTGVALDLGDRLLVSGKAQRREAGLSEDDAPDQEELKHAILLKVMLGAPTLAPLLLPMLGIDAPVPAAAVEAIAAGTPGGATEPGAVPATPGVPSGGPPALAAAADGVVFHALERAGARLRSKNTTIRAAAQGKPVHATHTVCASLLDTSTIDDALQGAWVRVPEIAERHAVDAASLATTLDLFARAVLASGSPYDAGQLAEAVVWLVDT